MDIEMPQVTGIEATTVIRNFNKDIPIVIFSAMNEKDIEFGAAREMMNDYFQKNNDTSCIIGVIEKYQRKIA